jgi:ClpP class serine protease
MPASSSSTARPARCSLSIKALEVAEEKEAVAQYGSDSDSGASLGDILGAIRRLKRRRGAFSTSNAIARINIEGLIRSDQERVEALERLGKSSYAAVVVHINSPGGTTAGSEQLYDSLMQLKAKKPLVVVVEGLAASGGYITAIASDHIVAQQTSLVGSIGVLFQFPNVSELLKTVGVKMEEIKSSPLKAAPNGFEPTSRRPARRSMVWSRTPMHGSVDW